MKNQLYDGASDIKIAAAEAMRMGKWEWEKGNGESIIFDDEAL